MLDRRLAAIIRPAVSALAHAVCKTGLHANYLTVTGFVLGLMAAVSVATRAYVVAAILMGCSRLFDALDGAVARLTQVTDAGGFLDIALDFVFYSSIPLAFAIADPARNALPAAVLLASFVGTGTSFLAFAVFASRRGLTNVEFPDKSFYFLGGFAEATETLGIFFAMCAFPGAFGVLAYVFSILCALTTGSRIWHGWRTFSCN